ncbi:cystathionine gamma-synthase [Hokovirus HKV1]|uniref:Cystathionine gamma-synthase n=1 Tax=Hokovirus HKV1 TaxID=1977638 RepID=A0A1V0SFP3_9VIRU|nr:cystathionine gamma-synthase [Hokovirus HKV1]
MDKYQTNSINYNNKNEAYYCRFTSNNQVKLENKLVELHQYSEKCYLTCSGMAAITGVFESLLTDKDEIYNIIICDDIYCDTIKVCDELKTKYKSIIHKIDISNSDNVLNYFENNLSNQNNIFFIESCTNPNGFIMNFDLIPNLRSLSKNFYCIVDNTWLTHEIFNPFICDVDIVVLSLAKYYSAGNCIAGAILYKNNIKDSNILYNNIFKWFKYIGMHISPYECDCIYENMKTLTSRLTKSYNNTVNVLDYLKNLNIGNINYPLDDNHISCKYFKKYFLNIGPSVFTLLIKINYNKAKKILQKLKIIHLVTSYGHKYTSICNYIRQVNINDVKYVQFRFSIGYEDDYEILKSGMDEFINLLK